MTSVRSRVRCSTQASTGQSAPPYGRAKLDAFPRDEPAPAPHWVPWTTAGGPDPAYDETAREGCRSCLTDPELTERFRAVEPHAAPVYEHMIRALDLVWE